MRKILGALALATLLAGCQTAPSKTAPPGQVVADPEIDEAANELEESKSDYESCVREQEDDRGLDCDVAKEMYEEDQEAYDDLLRKKKAKR